MNRFLQVFSCTLVAIVAAGSAADAPAGEVRGHYLEARTCQVYTGPCFANGEVGQTGKDAVMAWSVTSGGIDGVDLSGLKVVLILQSTDTLGFQGIDGVAAARSVILVDEGASPAAREALVKFARTQAGKAGLDVARVESRPIAMELDTVTLTGQLAAGEDVQLSARKARPGDCICSNEAAYYPPLAEVEHFAPGVTLDGKVRAHALGSHWTLPNARSAYMATFHTRFNAE